MATCRVCSFEYPDAEPRCPRCGFGSSSSLAAPATASPPMSVAGVTEESPAAGSMPGSIPDFVNLIPGVSVGPTGVSVSAQPRRKGLIVLFIAVMLALPIAGIVFAAAAINKATDMIPDVQDLFAPDSETGIQGDEEDHLSPAECEEILSLYLKKMFIALDKDPEKVSTLFIEASQRLGPGSEEYRDLVEIFSSTNVSALAATGHPDKAFKKSKPMIQKRCKG